MVLQAGQRLAAWCLERGLGQFHKELLAHRVHKAPDHPVRGDFVRTIETLSVRLIKVADPPQPGQSPGLQLGPTLAHPHEVATHMGPAEGQHQVAFFTWASAL